MNMNTMKHMARVAWYSILFTVKNKIQVDIKLLFLAAILHDIGKVTLRQDILHAPRKLNLAEMEYIKSHAHKGAILLRRFKKLSDIIETHHENYDGTGYNGLVKDQIPLESQIIRIWDVFDALISKRAYKDALTIAEVKEIMIAEQKNFNPEIFQIFIKQISEEQISKEDANLRMRKKILVKS